MSFSEDALNYIDKQPTVAGQTREKRLEDYLLARMNGTLRNDAARTSIVDADRTRRALKDRLVHLPEPPDPSTLDQPGEEFPNTTGDFTPEDLEIVMPFTRSETNSPWRESYAPAPDDRTAT